MAVAGVLTVCSLSALASSEPEAAENSSSEASSVPEAQESSPKVIYESSAIELIYSDPEVAEFLRHARQTEANDNNLSKFVLRTKNKKFLMSIGGDLNTIVGGDIGNNLYKVDDAGINFITGDIPVPALRDHKGDFFINPIGGNLHLCIVCFAGSPDEITAFIKVGTNGIGTQIKLKRAYIKWRGFTFGQALTLASDGLACQPPTIDPQGPCGDVTGATYQVNYTTKSYNGFRAAVGIEMPSFYSSNGVYLGKDYPEYEDKQVSTNVDSYLPDVPLWIEYAASDRNRIRATGIFRYFSYRDLVADKRRVIEGWGVQLSGNFSFYKPLTFNFQAIYGKGIGAYIQDIAGRQISFTPSNRRPGRMNPTPMMGLVFGASYNVTPKLQFNAVGSYNRVWDVYDYAIADDPQAGIAGSNNYKSAVYVAANCFYNISSYLKAGVEYLYGRHNTWNIGGADDHRIQAQIEFSF